LEKILATLEGSKYGLAFAAGMGAISSVTQLLTTGDHIVTCKNVYSGTAYYYDAVAVRLGITYDAVNATNLDNVRKAIKPNTRVNRMK
jgi:cystathionine beta-lyase/cystathionine gamma-synthase